MEAQKYAATSRRRSGRQSQVYRTILHFLAFAAVNITAALYSPFQDCDEVYNFWEPAHYLNHGYGFQTWEYSPDYAIRSWLYIALHAAIGRISLLWRATKVQELFWVRVFLAFSCAIAQVHLCSSVSRAISPRVASILRLAMLSTPGFFYSSIAFLPSSFSMHMAMLGFSFFIDSSRGLQTAHGVSYFGFGTILGWPFSAALIFPLFGDEIVAITETYDVWPTLARVSQGLLTLLPCIMLDLLANAALFGRVVFSPWRIVEYNVFNTSEKGPNIFGTEPWHFYFRNLLLNFNGWFLLALLALPLVLLQHTLQRPSAPKNNADGRISLTLPFYLWLLVFSIQPHKEERFMYPAYPFLCLNASTAAHHILILLGRVKPKFLTSQRSGQLKLLLTTSIAVGLVGIGLLRTIGTVTAYQAPLQIYTPLQQLDPSQDLKNLCLGKEWYRFSSSFFLPSNIRAQFIESEFNGLLPGHFSEETGFLGLPAAWTIPVGMNDENRSDPRKLVDIRNCTYLIDSQFGGTVATAQEPAFIRDEQTWESVLCVDFLDTSRTLAIPRALYMPRADWVPHKLRRYWGQYCLLKRRNDHDLLYN